MPCLPHTCICHFSPDSWRYGLQNLESVKVSIILVGKLDIGQGSGFKGEVEFGKPTHSRCLWHTSSDRTLDAQSFMLLQLDSHHAIWLPA